jgi:hypothetical protein
LPIAEKAYMKNGYKSLSVELDKETQIHLKIDKQGGQTCYSILQSFKTKSGIFLFLKTNEFKNNFKLFTIF